MKVEWVLHSVAVVVEGSFCGVLHMNDWVDGDGGDGEKRKGYGKRNRETGNRMGVDREGNGMAGK